MLDNGRVYGFVWRFEARTYQTSTKFISCNNLEISTIRQIHYTRCCVFVLYSSQSVSVMGQPYSLTSFGHAVGFLSDLAMCVAVKRGLYVSLFQSLRNFQFVQMFLKFYKKSAYICYVSQNFFCIF